MTDGIYWDDLGVAWCATELDATALSPRLKARLRRQAGLIRTGVFAGAVATAAGLALGAWTIRVGLATDATHFLARGAAVLLLSAMLGLGTAWLAGSARDDTRSLAEMLDLSLRRARVFGKLTALGFGGTAVAAVLGLVGYAIRVRAGDPPALSPLEPLLVLGLFATVLVPFHLRFRDLAARLECLRRALAVDV
jgi:hypothetical protein